jgi:curved DNA-binding protein CbpA
MPTKRRGLENGRKHSIRARHGPYAPPSDYHPGRMTAGHDPYQTLGVSPRASDDQLRAAYRRLVQLHHPDHNAGSAVSARRFEEVQEAYAEIRKTRQSAPPPRASARTGASAPPHARTDPGADARLADLEREIREAHLARERAQRARQSAQAAAAEGVRRPTPEELGYITTDDSLGKILSDARSQASERLAAVREPVTKRVADLLDELASKLSGGAPPTGQ